MLPNQVLLIESARAAYAELESILSFIGYQPVYSVTDNVAQVAAVIAVQDAARDDLIALAAEFPQSKAPPLFVLHSAAAATLKDLPFPYLGSLPLPLRYAQLVSALEKAQIYRESQTAKVCKRPIELFRSMAGNSRAVQDVRNALSQVAPTNANVLILGESGTGKEVVARNLHYLSDRRGKPFIALNCGAIPAELLESELFGHEKGAFTGAIKARKGRFQLADGGTLFLDEIGDMSMAMQVKLLRVLEEQVFERIGGTEQIRTDVRIIAATNADLSHHIKMGKFREDLYFRLNVFPIRMPPLRERVDDLPMLINDLVNRLEHERHIAVRFSPAAVLALCRYPWPGNVRELANLVERLAILYPFSEVGVNQLPEPYADRSADAAENDEADLATPSSVDLGAGHRQLRGDKPRLPTKGMYLRQYLNALEAEYIRQALAQADGVVTRAAQLLKMRRTTLVEKIRKFGLK